MKLRYLLVSALALCAIPLAACGPDEGTPGGSGGTATASRTSAGGGGGAATGRDGCLTGTWKVDLDDLADRTAAKLPGGGEGAGTGTITLSFDDAMTITYDAVLTITSTSSSGLKVGVQDTYAGAAASTDYQAKDGKLTGTMQTNTVTMKIAVIVGDRTQAASTGPLSGVVDLARGDTTYDCSGSNLTLQTSGIVWHLTKS
jgi:hypothetical protein